MNLQNNIYTSKKDKKAMRKTNIKCPRCHQKNYISLGLTSRIIKNINAKDVVDNSHLTLSVAVKNLNILDVLNAIKPHIFTVNTRI